MEKRRRRLLGARRTLVRVLAANGGNTENLASRKGAMRFARDRITRVIFLLAREETTVPATNAEGIDGALARVQDEAAVKRFSLSVRYAVDAPRSLSLRGRGADRVEGLGEAVVLLDADPNVVQVPITSAPLADVLPEITGLDGTPIPSPGDGRRPERDGRHSSQRQQAGDFPFHGTSR
jgi:hypothetical protein